LDFLRRRALKSPRTISVLLALPLSLFAVVAPANPLSPAQRENQEHTANSAYTNPLIHEKSPYLLLHAHNPVDWYPWGEEAFAKARREQKPIFLSIGYYTCHWCHVMERESYSNSKIAAVLNKYFVAIKVDREERPDVDRVYIAYVEASTGSAGWPLNVFLTPDLKPFYGGTYYPPGELKTLLEKIANAWAKDRSNLAETARRAGEELTQIVNAPLAMKVPLQPAILDKAFEQISASYDVANAGFGAAPKFPRPVALDFLLRTYARTERRQALEMTLATLRAMARGGIQDQLGGGFHRYALDARWRVPHFEKMLYDQAQLAIVFTEAWQITRDPFFQSVARDTLDFVLREMTLPSGGFASALDADSPLAPGKAETAEGAFYVWTAAEIESVLGRQSAAIFAYAYGIEPGGNVSAAQDPRRELAEKNVLYQSHSLEETGREFGLTVDQVREQLTSARKALFEARVHRPRPPADDKIVTAWNGMMLSALARAGAAFNDPRYLAAADATSKFLEAHLYDAKSKRLARSYRNATAAPEGFLDDYANLIAGLLDLYEANFQIRWLTWAAALQEKQGALFWDAQRDGYFDEANSDSSLPARTRESYDGAEPAPNSVAAMNLLRFAQFTDRAEWLEKARETLAAFGARLGSDPEEVPALASALDFLLAKKRQVLIAGNPGAEDTHVMLAIVHQRYLPNKILLFADGGSGQKRLAAWLPFVAGAHPIGGKATAYVCENYICKLPTADPAVAARLLDVNP
jgi:uncharacterized protein